MSCFLEDSVDLLVAVDSHELYDVDVNCDPKDVSCVDLQFDDVVSLMSIYIG